MALPGLPGASVTGRRVEQSETGVRVISRRTGGSRQGPEPGHMTRVRFTDCNREPDPRCWAGLPMVREPSREPWLNAGRVRPRASGEGCEGFPGWCVGRSRLSCCRTRTRTSGGLRGPRTWRALGSRRIQWRVSSANGSWTGVSSHSGRAQECAPVPRVSTAVGQRLVHARRRCSSSRGSRCARPPTACPGPR